jgi:hypothetical protein
VLFAMYDLPEIAWNLCMVYGLYVIYKRVCSAAQNPVVRKTAATSAMNLIQRWLK